MNDGVLNSVLAYLYGLQEKGLIRGLINHLRDWLAVCYTEVDASSKQ